MNCVRQAKDKLQCKVYDSLLALPPALEAARALMCVAVALSVIALLVGICSMKKIQCTGSNRRAKAYLVGISGVLFILTGIFVCSSHHPGTASASPTLPSLASRRHGAIEIAQLER